MNIGMKAQLWTQLKQQAKKKDKKDYMIQLLGMYFPAKKNIPREILKTNTVKLSYIYINTMQ